MSKIQINDLIPNPRKSISIRMIKNEDAPNSIVHLNTSVLLEEHYPDWYNEHLPRLVSICNTILEDAPVNSEAHASFSDPTPEESFKRAMDIRYVN